MANLGPEAPRHNVVDSDFNRAGSSLVVMCYGKKFEVQVDAQDLQDTSLSTQYDDVFKSFQADEEDDDAYESMCDWILHPCLPILRDVAAQTPSQQRLTLQDFFFPPTYKLSLFVSNGEIAARCITTALIDGGSSLIPDNDRLPPFLDVARFTASEIFIVSDERGDCGCEIPRKVHTDAGTKYLFKPAYEESQYARELECQTRIQRAGLHDKLRVSKLAGVVVSDDQKSTLGLLIEWIPSFCDLQGIGAKRQKQLHAQWRQQVIGIVEELHKYGVIWGDVHPGNIIVDLQTNAWVVDFGGDWIEPFVTREMYDTVEGDLVGIENVFKHLEASWEACETSSTGAEIKNGSSLQADGSWVQD